jgi:hypothetical protein
VAGLSVRTIGLLAALVLACVMVIPVRGQGEAAASTLADYRAALAEARAIVAGGGDGAVDKARAVLAGVDTVALATGETIALAPVLGDAGTALPPATAQARLDLLLAQLDAAAHDDLAARLAVLGDVLQRPEFTQTLSPLDRFWRWLSEQVNRFLPERDPTPAGTPGASLLAEFVGWGAIVAGAVAIIWLLSYWLRGLVLGMVADADARRTQVADDLPQTPGEARRRADTLAQSGNYREAVRNLYLSALLTLEQHGLVTTDRSLTNREVLARVPADHPIRPHFKPVVETFDDVWYGVHEPDQGTFGTYSRAIDELATLAATKE